MDVPGPEEIERDHRAGQLFLHSRVSELYARVWDLASTTYALVDALVAHGVVSLDAIRMQLGAVQEALIQTPLGAGLSVTLDPEPLDAPTPTVEVDCAARLASCRAACCARDVALSADDVARGRARWDAGRPYRLRRASGGRCVHHADDGRCAIHGAHPTPCRGYTCAEDKHIWIDFAARVPNPEGIEALFASSIDLGRTELARSTGGSG